MKKGGGVVVVESNFLNTLNGTKGKSNLPFFIE